MKKFLFILILLLAINLSVPNNYRLNTANRHIIEFTLKVNNQKDLSNDEIVRNKIILFKEWYKLYNRLSVADKSYLSYLNSS